MARPAKTVAERAKRHRPRPSNIADSQMTQGCSVIRLWLDGLLTLSISLRRRRREVAGVLLVTSVTFVLGWFWPGIWLMTALCGLYALSIWGSALEGQTVSRRDLRRIALYRKLWGEHWRKALEADHPALLAWYYRHREF